jgi:hypothetical protein
MPRGGNVDRSQPVAINGTTAAATVRLDVNDDVESASTKLTAPVWRIAKEGPSDTNIELHVVFSPEGLVDELENTKSQDADLGTDVVDGDDIARVRKFVEERFYVRDDLVQVRAAVWTMTSLGEFKRFIKGAK